MMLWSMTWISNAARSLTRTGRPLTDSHCRLWDENSGYSIGKQVLFPNCKVDYNMLIDFPMIISSHLPPLQYPTIPEFHRYCCYQILRIPAEAIMCLSFKILKCKPTAGCGAQGFQLQPKPDGFFSNYLIDHLMWTHNNFTVLRSIKLSESSVV